MDNADLFQTHSISIGSLQISESLMTSVGITLVLVVIARILARSMQTHPKTLQVVLEGIVSSMEDAIKGVNPDYAKRLLPLIGSLWIFLVVANLLGLVPGLESPTRDLSVTSALAVVVFFAVHWFGIRHRGFRAYMRHYLQPTPLLLPFHIISEFTRTIALAVRLFGNMMSLEIAALLVLLVAGFLAPIPLLMLHIIEALVQAYIFGILALIYIVSALQSHEEKSQKLEGAVHD